MTRVHRILPLLLLALGGGTGCTAIGYTVGSEMSDSGDKGWGHPHAIEGAASIPYGTPVQVGLPDGGFVRGIWLGVVALDSADSSATHHAARLGVGNRVQLDALFSSGDVVQHPTTAQVPDTLTFPLDGITELRVPGTSTSGAAKAGVAAGFAVDTTIVVIAILSCALVGLLALLSR